MRVSRSIAAGRLVAVAQRRAGDVIVDLSDAGQQLKKQRALFARKRSHNSVLNGIDRYLDVFQKLASGIGEIKQLLALVLGVWHSPNQIAAFQSLKHVPDSRSIKRNQRRKDRKSVLQGKSE